MATSSQCSEWAKRRWAKYQVPMETRFWSFVDKKAPDECWNWKGSGTRYGVFSVKSRGRFAHRVSYEINKGPIPDGKCVCHKCDNPKCVNPNHLWLGSHSENIKDAVTKGRLAIPNNKGIIRPFKPRFRRGSKYPDELVEKIRADYEPYVFTAKDISEKYGIPWGAVRNLIFVGNNYTLPWIQKQRRDYLDKRRHKLYGTE